MTHGPRMTAAVTAMITAVVGVLGTLLAPVLSQRLTSRQRAEEEGRARDGESAVRALLDLKEAEPRLSEMRRLMREDLGVAD